MFAKLNYFFESIECLMTEEERCVVSIYEYTKKAVRHNGRTKEDSVQLNA